MKKLLIYFSSLIFIIGCSTSKSELYEKTDFFVESLAKDYNIYGVTSNLKYTETTSDGLYQINPIGRLINVKILKAVDHEVYEELREDLEDRYQSDSRVNDVYINKGGTIMIDCRN